MVTVLKAVAAKDFKLDGVLYKKGHLVDYSKWPKHCQFQLRGFLVFSQKAVKKAERIESAKENISEPLKENLVEALTVEESKTTDEIKE